jgi:hypothetical protein
LCSIGLPIWIDIIYPLQYNCIIARCQKYMLKTSPLPEKSCSSTRNPMEVASTGLKSFHKTFVKLPVAENKSHPALYWIYCFGYNAILR